jgi:hypothetical protein
MTNPKPDAGFSFFFTYYGLFFHVWASVELLFEVLIMRQLNLGNREASIICAPLGFGAKAHLLYSLLSRDTKNDAGRVLLKRIQNMAERNSLAHGFMLSPPDHSHYWMINREVKEKYSVRAKKRTMSEMKAHVEAVMTAKVAAQAHFGITDDDINAYSRSIVTDAPNQP